MTYRIEVSGSVLVDDAKDAKDEAVFLQVALKRILPDSHIRLINTDNHLPVPFSNAPKAATFSGRQTSSVTATTIATTLFKNGIIDIDESSLNDYHDFVKLEDGNSQYIVDYRELYLALRDFAKNDATFKDDFKNVVSEVLANESLRGISFK